jgi:acetyl-CoA acyltransferase
VALVAGVRTPFARSGTVFRDLTAVQLARRAAQELLIRTGIDGGEIDEVVFGQVIPSVLAPNLAREVSLLPQLPRDIPAFSVNRACASAGQAISYAYDQITLGHADVVLAGGAEALSDIPILHSKRMSQLLVEASKARSLGQRLAVFSKVRPRDLVPVSPAIAEPSTGESMGQSAEKMAKENGISREAQDRLALLSHQRAAAAQTDGRLAAEIAATVAGPRSEEMVVADNLIRPDTSLEALAGLKPVFDRKYGSVTAGNSSPLTDGAACVLLASEEWASSRKIPVQAYLSFTETAAVDFVGMAGPKEGMLMAPAYAVPRMLDRAKLKLQDFDIYEIHEAFAAQVLCTLKAWESEDFCRKKLNRSFLGSIDRQKMNPVGSSVAIGHPFAATGARIVATLAKELAQRGSGRGLISICAAGGMGVTAILER